MNTKTIKLKKKILIGLFVIIFLGILVYIGIDMIIPIKQAIDEHSLLPVEEKFMSYGIWKYFFMVITQTILLITTVFPNQIIQIISGFVCGAIPGFICCMIGIFLGNLLIYFIFKKDNHSFNETLNNKQKNQLKSVNEAKESNKSLLFILSLYFVPAIPYGVASIYAANKKIGFFKYILITTLGAVPATMLCTLFGNFAIEEKFLPFTILLSFYCLIIVLSITFKDKIINHVANRSIRATILWLIPLFINTGFSIYYSVINDIYKLFINILVILGYGLLYTLLNKPVSMLFERTTKKYDMSYFQGPVKKAKPFLYNTIVRVIKPIIFRKFNVHVNKETMPNFEQPSVLIFNHPSKFDFLYSFLPVFPKKVNPVVAYYYFCNYRLGRLLKNLGAFPKYLYQPDVSAMKNIIRVIKDNGVLGIAPEGRLSAYGALEKIIPSTAKMVKKLGVQVIATKINGAYLTSPKWAKSTRKGKVTVDFKEILTKEQIKELSVNEIYEILKRECDYDDFKWQEENHIAYKGKNLAEGLEDILYICPVCKKEYTYSSNNDTITCSHCNTTVTLDKYYQFSSNNDSVPKNIRDWYLMQKEIERENVNNPDFTLTSHVTLKGPDPKGKGFVIIGEGYTTLNHQGITYKGIINNEEKEILFKIENLPAVPFGVREDFEVYHHNTLYYFIPDNLRECVKWSVASEQMYQKYLDDNNLKELEIE